MRTCTDYLRYLLTTHYSTLNVPAVLRHYLTLNVPVVLRHYLTLNVPVVLRHVGLAYRIR